MAATDDEAAPCTCGNRYRLTDPGNLGEVGSLGKRSSPAAPTMDGNMDLSFVHLETGGGGADPRRPVTDHRSPQAKPPPQRTIPPAGDSRGSALGAAAARGEDHGHSGFWGRYRYLRAVETAIEEDDGDKVPPLCLICVARVERALIADAERMENEISASRDAVRDEEIRSESWKRALVVAVLGSAHSSAVEAGGDSTSTSTDILHEGMSAVDLLNRQEDAFRREIAILLDAADRQEDEMTRLSLLQREQAAVIRDLRLARSALEEERNNVEIDARDFDSDHALLSRALVRLQGQVDRLSSHIHLPFEVFELSVDKDRGLRYPLINDLRLAYRPKGDVQWDEIQGAWSLAAQMLLSVASVFNFQTQSWKIVPLSHCAKLIYTEGGENSAASAPANSAPKAARSLVFNLGHPRTDGSRALLAWNALLHAVIQHATVQMHKAIEDGILESTSSLPSVPYEMSSPGQIGDAALARINPKDDAAWSNAIHRMSSNLLWLSECASIYVHQTTVLQAGAAAAAAAAAAANRAPPQEP